MSPERLGPVWKVTLAGNPFASPPAYFPMASGTVRSIRSTGTTATWVGGRSVTVRPRPGPPSITRLPVSAIVQAAVESPMSALPATPRKSSRSRHTATSTPASPSGPSTPISSSSSTSHRTSLFAPPSRASSSTHSRASSRVATPRPRPRRASRPAPPRPPPPLDAPPDEPLRPPLAGEFEHVFARLLEGGDPPSVAAEGFELLEEAGRRVLYPGALLGLLFRGPGQDR